MNLQRNYYEVLGLPPSASTSEIKNKYRELAKKFHPDLTQDKVLGQRIFAQINQAYRVLGDTERRSQYDATLVPERGMPAGSTSGVQATTQPQAATAAPPPQAARPAQAPISPQMEAEVQRLLGEAEMAMMGGKAKDARSICETILGMQPDNAKALGLLGDVYAQQGDPQRAIETYRKALQYGASPMIQSKLSRLTAAPAPSSATPPPAAPKSAPQPAKSGGFINRILGRNN
ncbi:hypothetical protein CCAX7_58480 [Capsulimonas corticalis]|uniref:Uncharacterized protein n=1 Tax=Capsulimonas corticalis TaxID=2219043 RepID=A0A402CZY5_9BACT|nr:J domain-containing protein [Capsulimonas corticalis]BDI33797.1 hypothetical protein CCAX7_58480 [Capsulimonas corticalis]